MCRTSITNAEDNEDNCILTQTTFYLMFQRLSDCTNILIQQFQEDNAFSCYVIILINFINTYLVIKISVRTMWGFSTMKYSLKHEIFIME